MKQIILFCSIVFLLLGCVKNNPKPVWLNLSKWTLVQNNDPSAQNHPTYMGHNFTDAWVYVDDKLVGVFELPCKIPVLTSAGTKSVRIYPTVRNNGISATKKIYPFVVSFEQNLDLVLGETYNLDLTTKYITETEFWIEDFTDNSPELQATTGVITIENDPAIAISGKYAHAHLSAANTLLTARTNAIALPGLGTEVYLEIDYKTDVSVLTSLVEVYSDASVKVNPNIQLNGASEWKKIYIDLRELVSFSVNAVTFQQQLDAYITDPATPRDIYIDNIRLVHF